MLQVLEQSIATIAELTRNCTITFSNAVRARDAFQGALDAICRAGPTTAMQQRCANTFPGFELGELQTQEHVLHFNYHAESMTLTVRDGVTVTVPNYTMIIRSGPDDRTTVTMLSVTEYFNQALRLLTGVYTLAQWDV